MTIKVKSKQPSKRLSSLIDNLVESFQSFVQLWNEVKIQGKKEGFTEDELKGMIRPKLKGQLSKMQIQYLFEPEYYKQKSKEQYENRNNIIPNEDRNEIEGSSIEARLDKALHDAMSSGLSKKHLLEMTSQRLEEYEQEEQENIITEARDISQPTNKELPTPLELYEEDGRPKKGTPLELYEAGVTHAEKVWIDLTGLKGLITSNTTDPLLDYIKPTRPYRMRIFKGLDMAKSKHYQRVLVILNMLFQDTLKMCLDINRELEGKDRDIKK